MRPTVLVRTACALAASAALLLPVAAGAAGSLRARLHAALAGFDSRGTGVLAVDLASGRVVYAHNANASLLPASNEKLELTYAALVALGPSFRMRTEVLGEGHLVDGTTWLGNLILKGYGDPTLDRAGLADLARRLRATGIRRMTGGLVADESWFDARRDGPGWKAQFVPDESRPLSALTVPGASGAAGAARLFRAALARAGVRVRGGTKVARAGGWPLAVRYSPTLEEILHTMDVESDNFTAELVLKQLGAVLAGRGTTETGAAVVRSILDERLVPLRGVRVADGSGLSALDRLTPKAIVTILQRAWADRDLPRAVQDPPRLRPRRHARGPDDEAAGPRQRAREDRHARRRLRPQRLRPRALRLRDPPERAAALDLGGPHGAGPLCHCLSRPVGRRGRPR